MDSMSVKIAQLWPEITLFVATCVVLVMGLSSARWLRQLAGPLSVLALVVAGVLAFATTPTSAVPLSGMAMYGKVLVAGVGVLLTLLLSGTVDREVERDVNRGKPFDSTRSIRGEFYAFSLFSLMGLMLCAGAEDLIFLFLALELTSLPTYIMVALSTSRNRSMEAAVKYFFLGAMGAALFLYGFALIYGGTGYTHFADIQRVINAQLSSGGLGFAGGINPLVLIGLVLSIVGMCFKIAAVPMHFYTPDVYQGAHSSVAGFLAFVPKAAGFFAILSLLSLVGWQFGPVGEIGGTKLPPVLHILLWTIAALTMTVGNVLAVMQSSVKRMLAYSSIAHSGYILVGVLVGPGLVLSATGGVVRGSSQFAENGVAAVWFYLLSYGITTAGAFAALASLEKRLPSGETEEVDHIDDLRGLIHGHPLAAWVLAICSMGLLGLPPLLGFVGKLPLFTTGLNAGEYTLVVILALNSAIAAYYYLRLAYAAIIDKPSPAPNALPLYEVPFASRHLAGVFAMLLVVLLSVISGPLGRMAEVAGRFTGPRALVPADQPRVEPVSVAVPIEPSAGESAPASTGGNAPTTVH
jgi:NADH-quinone oxidoreductase subunit N